MEGEAAEQGPSQSFSLTPSEVLLRYDSRMLQAREKDTRVEETRPMLENRYFRVDTMQLWSPSLLPSFGETCHRATYIHDFHVLLCNRRLVLVGSDGRHITFPPFDESLNDAYVERISERCILVIVALTSEVQVVLVGNCDGQRVDILQSVSCRTTFPVARIHHLMKGLYGLCCANCTMESLSIKFSDANFMRPQLEVNILDTGRGWKQRAMDYISREQYVHSLCDHYKGCLLLLSNSRLSLWMYDDKGRLHRKSFLDVSKVSAVAVVSPPTDRSVEEEQIAVLVTGNGGLLPLYLSYSLRKPMRAVTLLLGEICNLPRGVTDTTVSLVASCGTSLLLADQATASLVLSTQSELFCEAYHSSVNRVVSQLFLGKRICGVGAERCRRDSGDFVSFFVYCGDSTITLIGRVPREQLLRRQFSATVTKGMSALNLLDPITRVDVLLDAALGGLPLQHVSNSLTPLMHPRAVASNAAELSDGAKGIVRHTMRNLAELSRLCSSFQYWRLSEELSQSRLKLEKCCAVLDEVLNADGWLDCPLRENWKWSDNFTVALHDKSASGRSAINAQAELLQLLLFSLKDAATIAWLYDMMLQSNLAYCFPGCLEDQLWRGDPAAIQTTFCMDLLALSSKEVTEKLIQCEQRLPRRCRLAATLLSLVLTNSFEKVTAYVRTHIFDIARCDLLPYANDVMETHFPDTQSRLLLLLYYYPYHCSSSSDLIALVDRIEPAEPLRHTLSTILTDPACDDSLTAVVLDWMESHSLADSRIPTFAQVVVEMNLNVDPAHTLAGRFFSSCKQEAAGQAQQASFRFGELARSELAVPLAGRLLSVAHALQAMPSDVDRVTQFVLLLQQQLANLIDEHLQNGKDLLFTRSSIESDLALLREHYLSENRLFELAERYKALGGCSIQLDLLKIHPDSAQFTIANAITGVLTFLTAVGLPATEAVRRVLREYLYNFQAPLPLFPFVEFMAFDGQSPATTIHELAAAGVQLPVLFDTFMSLLDGHSNPLFLIRETMTAVAQLVQKIDLSMQHICAAHLLECSRSLLDGDQRTVSLSDEDATLLREIGDEMRRLLQRKD